MSSSVNARLVLRTFFSRRNLARMGDDDGMKIHQGSTLPTLDGCVSTTYSHQPHVMAFPPHEDVQQRPSQVSSASKLRCGEGIALDYRPHRSTTTTTVRCYSTSRLPGTLKRVNVVYGGGRGLAPTTAAGAAHFIALHREEEEQEEKNKAFTQDSVYSQGVAA